MGHPRPPTDQQRTIDLVAPPARGCATERVIVVFHSRVGVAYVGSGGAGPHGGRVDGAVVEVRAVAGLAAAAGVVWVVCAKGAACFVHTFFVE